MLYFLSFHSIFYHVGPPGPESRDQEEFAAKKEKFKISLDKDFWCSGESKYLFRTPFFSITLPMVRTSSLKMEGILLETTVSKRLNKQQKKWRFKSLPG